MHKIAYFTTECTEKCHFTQKCAQNVYNRTKWVEWGLNWVEWHAREWNETESSYDEWQ